MTPEDCVITLLFRHEGRTEAAMRLASTTSHPVSKNPASPGIPEYISLDECENIGFVSRSEVNGSAPIQVCLNDPDLNPLLLLEETEYDVLLSGNVKSAFPYIRDNSGDVALRELHFKGDGGAPIYKLIFKSYVGKGFLDIITAGDVRIAIPFEVRSKKIDYLNDYPRMLEDIASFSTSLLLNSRSPLYLNLGLSQSGSQSTYEEFLVLDYIFSELDLEGAYAQVRLNRHCEMFPEACEVPAGMAGFVDPSDIGALIASDNLIAMDGGPIAGRFAPISAIERVHTDDYDTPENRVIKDLILSVQRMIHHMIGSPLSGSSAYISGRLSDMRAIIDEMASDIWLRDVGDLTRIPFSSTVLQSRSGYAEMFSIYQILGLGAMFRHDDAEDLLKGHNSKVYEVYEYWCYTRLYSCLHDMSVNKPDFLRVLTNNTCTISIRTGKGVRFEMSINGSIVDVTLYYNRKFRRENSRLISYSVPLKPDYTLVICSRNAPDRRFIVNFDAKYKAKPKSDDDIVTDDSAIDTDCWEYDIYKMHTYRDALLQSWGSYVLFPGQKGKIYPKPVIGNADERMGILRIPSVGAVPLIPGSDKDDELASVLEELLSDISEIAGGELHLDPMGSSLRP